MNKENEKVEQAIQDKRTFNAIATGAVYKLPKYKVVKNVGLQRAQGSVLVPFVRGSKIEGEKEILPVEGIVHESLLSMMIYDIELKDKEFPSEVNPEVVKHLEAARELLENRQHERASRNVLGTYKK